MKLYKKLLPIASLTSVVAIVTPFVTSCGSGVIELDEYFPFDDREVLKTSKTIDIKTKKQYEINGDLSKIKPTISNDKGVWMLFATPGAPTKDMVCIKPTNVKVWVDGKELQQAEDIKNPNTFVVTPYKSDQKSWVIGGLSSIFEKDSKLKVTTSFEENKDDSFIYLLIDFESFIQNN